MIKFGQLLIDDANFAVVGGHRIDEVISIFVENLEKLHEFGYYFDHVSTESYDGGSGLKNLYNFYSPRVGGHVVMYSTGAIYLQSDSKNLEQTLNFMEILKMVSEQYNFESVNILADHVGLSDVSRKNLHTRVNFLIKHGFYPVSYALLTKKDDDDREHGYIVLHNDEYGCHCMLFPNTFTTFGFAPRGDRFHSEDGTCEFIEQMVNFIATVSKGM